MQLPDGPGSIRFDGVDRWVKLQVSDSPGKGIALGGVLLGIVGLMGSLFIRPRRAWVRVTRAATTAEAARRTVVELAGLDRSSGGDLADEVDELERLDAGRRDDRPEHGGARVSTADFAAFSDNAIMFASIVYVLAFLAHLVEWVVRGPCRCRGAERERAAGRRRRRVVERRRRTAGDDAAAGRLGRSVGGRASCASSRGAGSASR